MLIETTGGIDQTRMSPVVMRRRMKPPSCASSNAISVPKTIVSPTVTPVNTHVRRSTVQN